MRVLHVIPAFAPAYRYGGPIVSVLRLCQGLRAAGVETEVATTDADGPGDLEVPTDRWAEVEGVPVRYFRRTLRTGWGWSEGLRRFLAAEAARYDLIHVTGTFSFASATGGWAARRAGVPYLVSPRGNLQRWSLGQRRWKKVPYWWLVERHQLRRAAAIHATADLERDEVLRAVPDARIFIVPNGMDRLNPPDLPRRREVVAFLGRLHRKKGLDVLVAALSLLARERPGLEALVAGPDDVGEWARVEALAAAASPRPRIQWLGPVNGPDKYRFLASAGVFVLPSHSENFGMAVVEALACGTPVVVSRNCPWAAIEAVGAGAWVDNTPAAVAAGLRRVLDAGDDYPRMQAAARALAAEYTWPAIGEAMAGHYRTLVGGRPRG